jgi:hypothetical protein
MMPFFEVQLTKSEVRHILVQADSADQAQEIALSTKRGDGCTELAVRFLPFEVTTCRKVEAPKELALFVKSGIFHSE